MPEGSSRSRRGAWGFWVPLTMTVAVATLGVAAWVISQRESEEEVEAGLDYDDVDSRGFGTRKDRGSSAPKTHDAPSQSHTPHDSERNVDTPAGGEGSDGWGSRVSDAMARTPTPQQFLGSAGKSIATGISAASAAVNSAIQLIREEDKAVFQDHENWSEEADAKHYRDGQPASGEVQSQAQAEAQAQAQAGVQTQQIRQQAEDIQTSVQTETMQQQDIERPQSRVSTNSRAHSRIPNRPNRKSIVIVVSADFPHVNLDDQAFHEQASILSHIPKNLDFNKTKLYILIYAPCLKEKESFGENANVPGPPSLSSSFSNIGHEQAQPSEAGSPLIYPSSSHAVYNSIYSQALALVENSAMVIRYTTPNGHMHALRQLNPEIIYLQESLSGDKGSYITQLQSWYRYNVIVIVGADGGHGGIADSECETDGEPRNRKPKWWQDSERVARGKGIIIVDGTRLQDDWLRRLE